MIILIRSFWLALPSIWYHAKASYRTGLALVRLNEKMPI